MSNYLTESELAAFNASQVIVKAGDIAFNGYVFNEYDAQAYNAYLYDLSKERHKPTREFLLNQRHKLFCAITGMIGA